MNINDELLHDCFENDQVIYCDALGENIRIIEKIGSGGQAEVYKISTSTGYYALKIWYSRLCSKESLESLKKLVDNPINSDLFIWPKYIFEYGKRFGYIMDLIPDDYISISKFLYDKTVSDNIIDNIDGDFSRNIRHRILWSINIAKALSIIHRHQDSYKDLSLNNIFINIYNGKILYIDNDNITPNFESNGARGTPEFIAPEIIESNHKPDRLSDVFSLAIIIFYMLTSNHPFQGNYQNIDFSNYSDDEFNKKIYGYEACFIFSDLNDLYRHINANQEFIASLWQLFPETLRNKFHYNFTIGINSMGSRTSSTEWMKTLFNALSSAVICPYCGEIHFFEPDDLRNQSFKPVCGDCNNTICLPIVRIDKSKYVLLNNNDVLYRGYFSLDDNETDIAFKVEYECGRLSLINMIYDAKVYYNNQIVPSDYIINDIKSGDKIYIINKNRKIECYIAIPK